MNSFDTCQHELKYVFTDYDIEIGEDQIYHCIKNCGYEVIANIVNGEINVLVDYNVNNPIGVSSRPMNKDGKGIEPHIFDQIMDAQKERGKERLFKNKDNYLYKELFAAKNSDQATVIIKEIIDLNEETQGTILHKMFEEIKSSKKAMDVCMQFLKKYQLTDELQKRLEYDPNKDRNTMR